jgi:hypothetical protein
MGDISEVFFVPIFLLSAIYNHLKKEYYMAI